MRRDYYGVLGVGTSATPAQIRRAYQRLARQYSPDVNVWEYDARALFDEIAEAYRVLSDVTARSAYDRGPAPAAEPVGASTVSRVKGRRGDDLHVPVELSFRHAASGFEADLPVERLSVCRACEARGTARGAVPAPCSECAGTGAVWHGGRTIEAGSCSACRGSGIRVADPCPACRGRGVSPSRSVVHVVLPAGVDTGTQFRVQGEGHAGPFGGPRGDLVVVTRVHDDRVFTRKGDNLYCEARVSIVEATLGTRVSVPAIDGELSLTLPPGTQPGQVFRLRGKGMPRLSGAGRGDLYVTARVEIPHGLDARAQDLLRQLARLLPDSGGPRPVTS